MATPPVVSYQFPPTGPALAPYVGQDFADIIKYISDRNDGTASWDAISVAGNAILTTSDTSDLYLKIYHNNATGDPFVWFKTNATDWSAGIDNSDSDSFKISASATPGTSDALTITTGLLSTFAGPLGINGATPSSTNLLAITGSGGVRNIQYQITSNHEIDFTIARNEGGGSFNNSWVWYMPASSKNLHLYGSTPNSDVLKVDTTGSVLGQTNGAGLAMQHTYNSISSQSTGDTSLGITTQNSKTFTWSPSGSGKTFVVILSNGESVLVVTSFATATITILGSATNIVASSSPGAGQLGIFKSSSAHAISFKSGSSFTSTATSMVLLSLSGPVSASTNWA